MPGERRNQNQRDQFAIATALGQRVSVWAKQNGVPRRTCYHWRKTPGHNITVQEVRRRVLNCVVRRFARNLTKAIGRVALLATESESESVRLRAARAVIRESLRFRVHADLGEQIVDIERRLDERGGSIP